MEPLWIPDELPTLMNGEKIVLTAPLDSNDETIQDVSGIINPVGIWLPFRFTAQEYTNLKPTSILFLLLKTHKNPPPVSLVLGENLINPISNNGNSN